MIDTVEMYGVGKDEVPDTTQPFYKEREGKFEGRYSISIVLPTYNEEAVIGATLEEVLSGEYHTIQVEGKQ